MEVEFIWHEPRRAPKTSVATALNHVVDVDPPKRVIDTFTNPDGSLGERKLVAETSEWHDEELLKAYRSGLWCFEVLADWCCFRIHPSTMAKNTESGKKKKRVANVQRPVSRQIIRWDSRCTQDPSIWLVQRSDRQLDQEPIFLVLHS